jgi:XisH protein
MSRRDKFHDAVRHALEKEGWTIKLPLHLNHIFDSAQPSWLSGVVGAASPRGDNQRRT